MVMDVNYSVYKNLNIQNISINSKNLSENCILNILESMKNIELLIFYFQNSKDKCH
jgi:hypothetical protein